MTRTLTILFMLLALPVWAADYLVNPAYPAGGGTSWTDPHYNTLPPTGGFERGSTYWLASGQYPGLYLNTPANGQTITIKKATEASHFTDEGWQSSFDSGPAQFNGDIRPTTDDWVFDGVRGGGPGSWKSNHGFKINNGIFYINADLRRVDGQKGDDITLKHTEIAYNSGSYLNGGSTGGHFYKNFTASYCWFRGPGTASHINNNLGPFENILYEYNYFDDYCLYCSDAEHGEVASMQESSMNDFTFRYNLVRDCGAVSVRGNTGGLLTSGDGYYIYGNVFHRDAGDNWKYGGDGFIGPHINKGWIYLNSHIYNNTFINIPQDAIGAGGGNTTGNNNLKNNYFYNSDTGLPNGIYDTSHNHFQDSGDTAGTAASSGTGDPFVSVDDSSSDYAALNAATEPGVDLGAPYNVDMWGNTRGSDGTWDRGAIEFGGVANTNPPTITTQPASTTKNVSQTASFSVLASGASPLSYQWRTNGVVESGKTSSTYPSFTVAADSPTNYAVVITNAYGSVTSSTAVLTIDTQPVLGSATSSYDYGTVNPGESATNTFDIYNTGSASITWTGSVAAPFYIVGQSSFTNGVSTTNTITVRFSPSAGGNSYSDNLLCSGGTNNNEQVFIELTGASTAVHTNSWSATNGVLTAPMDAQTDTEGGQSFYDDFTSDPDLTWTTRNEGTAWSHASGQVTLNSGSSYIYPTNTDTTKQWVSARYVSGSGYAGVLLRATNTLTSPSYAFRFDAGNPGYGFRLRTVTNSTGIGDIAQWTRTLDAGDHFGVKVESTGTSTVWTLYDFGGDPGGGPDDVDWGSEAEDSTVISTDPATAADTGLGVGLYSGADVAMTFDNFRGGDWGSAGGGGGPWKYASQDSNAGAGTVPSGTPGEARYLFYVETNGQYNVRIEGEFTNSTDAIWIDIDNASLTSTNYCLFTSNSVGTTQYVSWLGGSADVNTPDFPTNKWDLSVGTHTMRIWGATSNTLLENIFVDLVATNAGAGQAPNITVQPPGTATVQESNGLLSKTTKIECQAGNFTGFYFEQDGVQKYDTNDFVRYPHGQGTNNAPTAMVRLSVPDGSDGSVLGGDWACVFTNSTGNTTSTVCTVTWLPPPNVTNSPPPSLPLAVTTDTFVQTIYRSSAVTLTVTVTNGAPPYTYQWKNLTTGTNIAGATNASYTYTPASDEQFQCTVTDTNNNTATGNIIYVDSFNDALQVQRIIVSP